MRIQKGLDITKSDEGYSVVSLHYTADPEKDTPEWLAQAIKPYPGGQTNPYFRKEFEIDFEAVAGQPVYADLLRDDIHFITPFEIPEGLNKYRIIDPGWRNPTCCLWVAMNWDDPQGFLKQFPPGAAFFYREHYVRQQEVPWHRKKIKNLTGSEKIKFTLIDPKSKDKTQASEESIFEHFRNNSENDGIKGLRPANNTVWDGILKVRDLLNWQEVDGELIVKPKVYFFKTLTNLRKEMKFYCWEDYASDLVKERKDPQEKPRKKDDHGPDNVRYFANEGIKATRTKQFVLPKYRDIRAERKY